MEEQKYRLKKDISRRIKSLHLTFTGVVIFFLVYIIVFVMFNKSVSKGFEEVCKESILSTEVVKASRGSIYSRNGEPLATSITRKTLLIDFGNPRFDNYERFCLNADTLSRKLAAYFGDRSAREYYDELIKWRKSSIKKEKRNYVTTPRWYQFWRSEQHTTKEVVTYRKNNTRRLFRDVDMSEWLEIKNFPLLRNGLGVTYRTEDHEYRVYPQGDIALRTIGRVEHHRSYGIEYAMRDTLAGHNGKQLMQTIAPGYKTRVADKSNIEAQNGYDVITTLDIDVQDVADKALQKQLIEQNAIWGTTIVMECATGDILAMANLRRKGTECVEDMNYAIGVPVNPGSTFKLVSAMALLEKGVPTTTKYHSGLGKRVEVGGAKGATVQDSHAIARESGGIIDMRRAFSESANVYFTKAVFDAFKEKPIEFSNWCRKLQLDTTVGLESMGANYFRFFKDLNRRHGSQYNALINMAYGYGIDITPLHTITMYNAVANNGKMVAPRLILRTERNGEVVSEAPIRTIDEHICSKSTIDTLRMFMEDVSREGTAKEYFGEKVCSFSTGSKTGTAQVNTEIDRVRYTKADGYYYGSMVTYLPADNPRYTIMTAIFTKRQPNKTYYGAGLAGPVQKQVATFLHNRNHCYTKEESSERHYATDIKGGNIRKMREVASEYGTKHSSEERKGWGKCELNEHNQLSITSLKTEAACVPNVIGMGLNDALYLLEKSGLTVEFIGQGKVIKQSLAPNTAVANTNKRIKIKLQ